MIGKTLQVNGLAATVVGVAPPSFTGFTRGQRVDMWVTVSQYFTLRPQPADRFGSRETSWLSLVGRTRPGVAGGAGAGADDGGDCARKESRTAPSGPSARAAAGAGDTSLVDDLGRPLRLLMLVVGLILVIARRTSPTCCSPAPTRGSGRSRCGRRSAPAARASSASC